MGREAERRGAVRQRGREAEIQVEKRPFGTETESLGAERYRGRQVRGQRGEG